MEVIKVRYREEMPEEGEVELKKRLSQVGEEKVLSSHAAVTQDGWVTDTIILKE